MIAGAPDSPREVRPGYYGSSPHMTEQDTERGEKRGVLSTGRAHKLGETKEDADADADNDDTDDDREG